MIKLMKEEIIKEMEAIHTFVELAIESQKAGYFKAAEYFLEEAKEDIQHAFKYAVELEKHDELHTNKTIKEIAQKYHALESGAVDRLTNMHKEASSQEKISSMPFIFKMIEDHSNEAYKAKKLADKINILSEQKAINDIEELFEELLEK